MKLVKSVKKNLNKVLYKIKKLIIKNKKILYMVLPFFLMELFVFIFGLKVNYFNYRFYSVIFFDICWIFLFIGLSTSFKKILGKIIYLIFSVGFAVLFTVSNIYFSITKSFFDFSQVESAGEGAPYIIDALKNCSLFVYISIVIVIISIVFSYKNMYVSEKNDFKQAIKVLLVFMIVHTIIPYTLGSLNKELTWSNWRNPREIYTSFNDNNKSLKVSGFFEYEVRSFYITFIKSEKKITQEEIDFLQESFEDKKPQKNKMTSIFKDKNLIIVQLEGADNWLITEEDTPTLYKMMNESYNFKNHYSFYNGGGSTFNSEFAVNTGFVTPISYIKNAYTFNKNDFPYSLANMFKKEGYQVNAFHMNSGEYYSRKVNYLNWGYDNYYGLKDQKTYSNEEYQLDRELILNEQFNTLMFPKDTKFIDYIIAYSSHMPFTNTKGVCKKLYNLDLEEEQKKNPDAEIEFREMSEEECARRQVRETDYMMELLLKNLKEKDLIDNTAMVVFTDHYLYTLEDQSILSKYKNTSNNLINNTPFFIWSNDIKKPQEYNRVTSQFNILPTIFNLFGIGYNVNNYIGEDVFSKNYSSLVFFCDYSWYDGNVYVDNGTITNKKKIYQDELEEKSYKVNQLIKKNDLTLKYNYFKQLNKNKEKESTE